MRVLFDVSHPAHVHLFKYAIKRLENEGHNVIVTSRDKDLTTELLDAYAIEHTPISTKGDSKISLVTEWIGREVRMISEVISFDPDVIVSRLNPPAAHASTIVGCPSIIFDDSEIVQFAGRITHPFADVICTPATFERELGDKQKRYDGFQELAYLHPNQFEPNPYILEQYGIASDETYSILRFVSWGAHHDVSQEGFTKAAKEELVSSLSNHGEVYITSETELPPEFEPYRIPIPPEEIHQLLYYADLYVGDSQTMATEAAVLGTPAIRSNTFAGDNDMSNFVELEHKYRLMRSTNDEEEAIKLARSWIKEPDVQSNWETRRENLLEDTVDITEYIIKRIREVGE